MVAISKQNLFNAGLMSVTVTEVELGISRGVIPKLHLILAQVFMSATSACDRTGILVQWFSCLLWKSEMAGSNPTLFFCFQRNKMFLLRSLVKFNIVGSLRDGEIACSASDRQGSSGGLCHLIHLNILKRFTWPSLAYMCTFPFCQVVILTLNRINGGPMACQTQHLAYI